MVCRSRAGRNPRRLALPWKVSLAAALPADCFESGNFCWKGQEHVQRFDHPFRTPDDPFTESAGWARWGHSAQGAQHSRPTRRQNLRRASGRFPIRLAFSLIEDIQSLPGEIESNLGVGNGIPRIGFILANANSRQARFRAPLELDQNSRPRTS
jgi:hypothetical protein